MHAVDRPRIQRAAGQRRSERVDELRHHEQGEAVGVCIQTECNHANHAAQQERGLATGEVGFGYTLGRDREKAMLIALCDAMVQSDEHADAIETQVVAPLRVAMIERRNRKVAEAAATRVDFYTLVRGEG